ncbi:PepSY domain-containing protein [Mammaliicoccus sciuri]|uniref:PepSY domain-containing protein n=1 Tax=Mammaliicoccus sciuri TaxID=1296 RepID=UPI001FB51106|nr:PepSY domain-containing protein [Mammaliicoccus sciuri]MCJ0912353.1 PepSY domain-containing protein [Mammaliicoccus sciuri]
MKIATKHILVLLASTLFIVLSVIIYMKANEKLMKKEEVEKFVTDRYKGNIEDISLSDDESLFHVNIKDSNKVYSLDIDRKKEVIKNVKSKTIKNKEQSNIKEKKQKENPRKKEKKSLISEKEAKQISHQKVGGKFIDIKKNTNTSPNTYTITQYVDDDEGAVVTVNAVSGKINSVSWFNIEQPQLEYNAPKTDERQEAQTNNGYYYEQDDDFDDDDEDDD